MHWGNTAFKTDYSLLFRLKTFQDSLLYPKIRSCMSLNAQVAWHSWLSHRHGILKRRGLSFKNQFVNYIFIVVVFIVFKLIIVLCGCHWWNTMRVALKACLLPLCGSTPTKTMAVSVELRSLDFPDILTAGECSTRVIAASRRSSLVLPNPEAKHTQTWRYHGQARCGSLFAVRFI